MSASEGPLGGKTSSAGTAATADAAAADAGAAEGPGDGGGVGRSKRSQRSSSWMRHSTPSPESVYTRQNFPTPVAKSSVLSWLSPSRWPRSAVVLGEPPAPPNSKAGKILKRRKS